MTVSVNLNAQRRTGNIQSNHAQRRAQNAQDSERRLTHIHRSWPGPSSAMDLCTCLPGLAAKAYAPILWPEDAPGQA
eukprot:7007137-Pyramimonas_sp.AAC.1